MPTSTRAVGTSVFTIRRGKFAIAQRADRGVRPYRTLYVCADGVCNFAIAFCWVDVGTDPYGHRAGSPLCILICDCTLRGRCRAPPLRHDRGNGEKSKFLKNSENG